MVSDDSRRTIQFLEKLKNGQPIAFLASLSMIIAVFSYSNVEFIDIYTNSVIAAFMFVLSFVASIGAQLELFKEGDDYFEYYQKLTRFGTYSFFGIGLLYIGFVVYEFGKLVPQIILLASGWHQSFIGFFLAYAIILIIKRSKGLPKNEYRLRCIEVGSFSIFASGFLITGLNHLVENFIGLKIQLSYLTLYTTLSVIPAIIAGSIRKKLFT